MLIPDDCNHHEGCRPATECQIFLCLWKVQEYAGHFDGCIIPFSEASLEEVQSDTQKDKQTAVLVPIIISIILLIIIMMIVIVILIMILM